VPANLAEASSLRCAGCGFSGAPPPEVGSQLHAARAMLFSLDVRLRQLSSAQRRALERASTYRLAFILVASILALLLSCWALAGLSIMRAPEDPTDDPGVSGILFALMPISFFAVIALASYRYIQRKHRALENACAARPPREKGEPAGCHVCGAPLSASSEHCIVRCAFCQADNLVAPQVFARISGKQAGVADAIERDIAREASAASGAAGVSGMLMLPAAIAMPFVAILWMIIMGVALHFVELAPNMKYRYVTVTTPAGECVARLRRRGGKEFLDFSINHPEGVPEEQAPPEGARLETFDVTALRDRTIRMRSGKAGRIVKMYETAGPSNDNSMEIEPVEGGSTESRYVRGACFAEPSPPAAGSGAPANPK
jgi:hypothetical protein